MKNILFDKSLLLYTFLLLFIDNIYKFVLNNFNLPDILFI
jgi:hypothetical protein